jgi:hypothetical protein
MAIIFNDFFTKTGILRAGLPVNCNTVSRSKEKKYE